MMRVAHDDDALWQSFKSGDRESFHSIYLHHFKPLYEYGMRLVGDQELVKDGIQDLFVKLWTNKANLSGVSAIRSYLLVALRTTLYNRLEKNNRIQLSADDEQLPFEMVFSVESDFINKEARTVQAEKLIAALNQLTPRQKEVIYLRYFEELDYDQIAAVMHITVKATYKLTARGLETLRQVLGISGSSLIILLLLIRS
jgi:RNA polymerase sigma factor (sigma-70 family)